MLQLSENSMKLQKTTGQPKEPWEATRASHITSSQVHGQNKRNNPAGEGNAKFTLTGETEGTVDQKTSCWNRLQYRQDGKLLHSNGNLGAGVEKFKVDDTANCYTRPVCFKYSKIWFNNGICGSTSVLVCTTSEFLSCGNSNYWCRNFQTSQ